MKAAVALLALVTSVAAQTGPWTDGELIVKSHQAGFFKIFRVVPETGATAVLASPLYYGGWSGSMAFDSYRGGLLANISLPPDGPFQYRLWLIAHDGTAAAMPGFTGSLRALASTGDGRIFFIRHGGGGQGPQTVESYDAADNLQTLKQADGVTPFQIEVEHLLYHAPSNALIGASSNWWSATDCGPVGASVYRIPLSSDGLRVSGPVTCSSVTTLFANEEIMSLDHLPNGKVLVTVASGNFPSTSVMLSVDPVTLAHTTWADPSQGDIDGGVWSARLGKAVLHAAWSNGFELRAFSQGQNDIGGLLATSQAIGGWGGYSPDDDLFEVDLNGPGCDGLQAAYGAGLAGKQGFVPLLGAIGCPDVGQLFTLSINGVVGGAPGALFVGLSPAALPFQGGTLHLFPILLQVPISVGGAPGLAGAGSLALPAVLAPAFAGLDIYLQAAFVDSFAVSDVSLTNGLHLQGN